MDEQIKMASVPSHLSRFAVSIPSNASLCEHSCATERKNCEERIISKDGYIEEFYIELAGISHHGVASYCHFGGGNLSACGLLPHIRFAASILFPCQDSLYFAPR